MSFNTPVLLIAWRRPDTTRKVIDAIRAVQPSQVFVACDGPKPERPGEAEKVMATREVIEREIDWPCTIKRRYSEINQGCKLGVSSAITWFFENVEAGIILEDDCLPHPDFFTFCSSLLEFYRNDERVWVITGDNFQNGQKRGNASYYFSRYNHVWGWATWCRAWKHYQGDIPFWTEWKQSADWQTKIPDPLERLYWTKIFNTVYANGIDTWDYPWTACVWYHGGLTLTPNCNLVTNIGFGKDATHTTGRGGKFDIISTETLPLSSLSHPAGVFLDQDADNYVFEHHFGGKYQRGIIGFLRRLLRKVKSLLSN